MAGVEVLGDVTKDGVDAVEGNGRVISIVSQKKWNLWTEKENAASIDDASIYSSGKDCSEVDEESDLEADADEDDEEDEREDEDEEKEH